MQHFVVLKYKHMFTPKKGEVNYRFDNGYFKCWASINQKVKSKLGFHLIVGGN